MDISHHDTAVFSEKPTFSGEGVLCSQNSADFLESEDLEGLTVNS